MRRLRRIKILATRHGTFIINHAARIPCVATQLRFLFHFGFGDNFVHVNVNRRFEVAVLSGVMVFDECLA